MACSSIQTRHTVLASDGAACNINIQGLQLEQQPDLPESLRITRREQIL